MCQYMMGEADAARTAFEQALKTSGDFPDKADARKRITLLTKQESGSGLKIQDFETLVRQQPDDLMARMRLAEEYETAGAFGPAAKQYREVLELNPRFVPAIVRSAELYLDSLNDQAKALEYAKLARQI